MAQPKRKNSTAATELPKDVRIKGKQSADGSLTEMQRQFVHHLVHHKMGLGAAARQAGFSQPASAATFLMKNPKIQKAIAAERLEYAIASQMTRQKVIDGFTESIDIARLQADPIAMISGWREIGKMCGLYEAQKTEVKISVNGQVMLNKLNGMSDQELLALDEGDLAAIEGEFSVREP